MSWTSSLPFVITPKSGPARPMTTLLDANHVLSKDLPFGFLKRPHWQHAARTVLAAAETGDRTFIRVAFEALVGALDVEGWMTRAAPAHVESPAQDRLEASVPPAAAAPVPAAPMPEPLAPAAEPTSAPHVEAAPDNIIPFPSLPGRQNPSRIRRVTG